VGIVVDRFRREGASGVVMSTLARMKAAQHVYRLAGFVRDPARDWSPLTGVDRITYRLDLTT
jgi:hypothetical protein